MSNVCCLKVQFNCNRTSNYPRTERATLKQDCDEMVGDVHLLLFWDSINHTVGDAIKILLAGKSLGHVTSIISQQVGDK